MLNKRTDQFRSYFVINEVALRRLLGNKEVVREQLRFLVERIREDGSRIDIRIARSWIAVPAVLGGPFVVFLLPGDSDEKDLVYLETRTGGTYTSAKDDVEHFNSYFDSLLEVAIAGEDAAQLIEGIIRDLDDPEVSP